MRGVIIAMLLAGCAAPLADSPPAQSSERAPRSVPDDAVIVETPEPDDSDDDVADDGEARDEPDPIPQTPPLPTPAPARTDLPAIGETLGPADPSDTSADAAWNSFLTNHPRTDCAMDTFLAWVHDRCRPLRPVRASTSSTSDSDLRRAFDLDACTTFDAGPAPQSVELSFARAEEIDLIVLDPGPRASGNSRHVIETRDRRGRWVARAVLFGAYYDSVLYALRLPEPIRTDRLRVRTIQASQSVELRELVPMSCEGEVAIHVEGIPPVPPPAPRVVDWHDPRFTRVPGRGPCRADADCVPSACCNAPTCVAARLAPRCHQIGCDAACNAPMDCGRGACICQEGRCGMATSWSTDETTLGP